MKYREIANNSQFLILATVISGATACAGPRMVPPKDFVGTSRILEVKDRSAASGMLVNESFQLGSYQILDVDRDATSKSSFSVGGYGKDSTSTGYSFGLKGQQSWKGTCASLKSSQDVGSFSISGENTLICECSSDKTSVSVKVGGQEDNTAGELIMNSEVYQITAVNEMDGSSYSGGPAGYRVDRNDKPVAAAEVLHPGRIWLAKELADKESEGLSCVFSGLMLYKKPSGH